MPVARQTLVLVVLGISSLAGCREGGRPGAPTVDDQLLAGFQNLELDHGGEERIAVVYAPAAALQRAAPLVLLLHGGFGNGNGAIEHYEMAARADAHGFILVAPDGLGTAPTWNAGECCGYAARNNVDDVGFARALVTRIGELTAIDPTRVYATGMSNGAAMSYRLACDAADVFAAVAPVSGLQTIEPCQPSQPVALLHIHGSVDQNVPMSGGVGPNGVSNVDWPSLDSVIEQWRSHDGCTGDPTESYRRGETVCLADSTCSAGTTVEVCVVDGSGHTWPPYAPQLTNDPSSDDIHASDYATEFLLRHHR